MNKLTLVGLAATAVVATGCGFASENKEPAPGISFGDTHKPQPTNSIAGPRVPKKR
jgi:hypothetical protein